MECKCTQEKVDLSLIDSYLDKYTGKDAKLNLIAILQHAQSTYGYLPQQVIKYIATRTGVKHASVMGVVTFYTQFRLKPVGKNLILICQGTACHVNGSGDIEDAVKEHLGVQENEISPNGLFTYTNVACLGCCSLAPAIMIGDKTYGNLTKEATVNILKDIETKN